MFKKNRKIFESLVLGGVFLIITLFLVNFIIFLVIGTITHELIVMFLMVIIAFITMVLMYYLYRFKLHQTLKYVIKNNSQISLYSEYEFQNGIIIFDEYDKIIYISPWLNEEGFSLFFRRNISLILKKANDKNILKLLNSYYEINISHLNKTIFVRDVSEVEGLKLYLHKKQLATIVISKEFSDRLKMDELNKTKINLKINEFLNNWIHTVGGILNTETSGKESSLAIGSWLKLQDYFEDDRLIREINGILDKQKKDISISIGVTFGNKDLNRLFSDAQEALLTAKSRGGNQIVLKHPVYGLKYLGQSSVKTSDDSKIKNKFFYSNFILKLETTKEVFLTSHIFADLDSLASAIALATIIKDQKVAPYIIIESFDSSAQFAYNNLLSEEVKKMLITEEEAIELKTNRSLFVVLDVNDKNRIQGKNLYKLFEKEDIFIIDHHRIGKTNIPSLEKLTNIDTRASSTSEIITEFFMFKDKKSMSSLDEELSTLLLSGIYLDTNEFLRNVSSKTFEASSFLTKNNANPYTAASLLKHDISDLPIIAKTLFSVKNVSKGIVISVIDEKEILDDIQVSKLSDMLLEYKEVLASFVVSRTTNKQYKLSARSTEKVNVQLICEKLGGGGHFNVASAQWDVETNKYKDIEKKIISTIKNRKDNK